MFKLLNPKHNSLLGMDISPSSIKLIEISQQENQYEILAYGQELLPPKAVEGNSIKDTAAVAKAIQTICARENFLTKEVAVAVPDAAVITKVVQINDGLSASEMEELIVIEADKYIPYPIDELNIDFEIIGHSTKNTELLDVLVVASRAENVNSRVEAITQGGLVAKIVDVESYAIERLFQALFSELFLNEQEEIVAVIDIGMSFTHLFIIHNFKVIFTREEEFGGKQLVSSIAHHYQISELEAMDMIKQETFPENYQTAVLDPFIQLILMQIKRTLQFFFSTSHHTVINRILLAGGIAQISGLTELVQEKTGIKTNLANPVGQMTVKSNANQRHLLQDSSSLMVACGLALRKVR